MYLWRIIIDLTPLYFFYVYPSEIRWTPQQSHIWSIKSFLRLILLRQLHYIAPITIGIFDFSPVLPLLMSSWLNDRRRTQKISTKNCFCTFRQTGKLILYVTFNVSIQKSLTLYYIQVCTETELYDIKKQDLQRAEDDFITNNSSKKCCRSW